MPKRVLLVDYELHSVERVRGVLREPDYEIVPARDGEEALNTFSSSRFDLVLLSGMLPRLPSAEVIREIRRRGGATAPPILLMISGYRGTNAKADAQRVGAFDLLSRPFSDETLRQAAAGAIAATETAGRGAGGGESRSSLTSSDIFSDILQEVARESQAAPAVRAPSTDTDAEVEKRLRDTLSGVLPRTPPAGEATPVPRRSTEAEVERLLSQTLSGLRTPRPRPAPAPPAVPVPAARLEEPAAVSSPGPDRFGQYEILERIASGGMAELFRARRRGVEGFEKIVAIKKILPHISDDGEFITMFADEAKLAAQLNHPNIVHIFDLGKVEDGGYFIAMEHVEGRDLRSILQLSRETGQPLPISLSVAIAAKVAAALDYAHRRRGDDGSDLHIVHRDISPPNILVSSDGDVKLCDFGIAKAASKVSRTESGALKGKVPYMSPEQAWGRPVDHRSDIYSLGSVLFEMVTGRKLFQGDSDLNVLEKVRAGEVVPPSSLNPDVWPALDSVVLKALAVKPEDRYAEASEMLRDLEAVLRTYEPPPTSADLAVFVRSLETRAAALREARIREEQQPAPPPPPVPESAEEALGEKMVPPPEVQPSPAREAPPSLAREAPPSLAREAPPSVVPPEAPASSALFGSSFPEKVPEGEGKNRARLYALIAAAAVVLALVVWWAVRKPTAVAVPVVPTPVAVAQAPVTSAPVLPTVAPPTPDSKAIREEAQRQIAAKRKELQKSAEAAAKPTRPAEVRNPTPVPARPTAAPRPAELTPQVKTAEVEPVRVEPTAIPTPVEVAPVVAAPVQPPPEPAESAPVLSRGDLVGPGPGVVEPVLTSSLRIAYPPAARGAGGKVVVLILVNEEGTVSEARLEQGISARPVNDAVLEAVRRAKFRPATKNQIPVKMWRTIVVDVKP
jgi:TonB family protein